MAFKLHCISSILYLDTENLFRNDAWAEYFGVFQKVIDTGVFEDQEIKVISIDLSRCRWADPLPLLSLLILLNEWRKKGRQAMITVPKLQNRSSETDKVLKFLSDEGFLDEMAKCAELMNSSEYIIESFGTLKKDLKPSLEKINSALHYTNSTLLKATIIDVKNEFGSDLKTVDAWIEEKIKIVASLIRDRIPAYSQRSLLHRLKIVLVETVQNIVKHAYRHSEKSFAGIYIRYRNGLDNSSLSNQERKKLNVALREENEYCPRLTSEFLELKKGCIEAFVIDHGIGFIESLRGLIKSEDSKYPFRYAYDLVFNQGKRRSYTTIPDSTFKGGLFHVGEMISNYQDYITGRDENEWMGGLLPLEKDSYSLIKAMDNENIKGLSWIIRLSWRGESEIGLENWTRYDGSPNRHPVYREMEENKIRVNATDYPVYDFRYNHNRKPDRQKTKSDDYCLLLPGTNPGKYSIWMQIQEIAGDYEDSKSRVLIIGDIPEYEKQTYIAAIHKVQIVEAKKNWTKKFKKIILITRRLSTCILERGVFIESQTYLVQSDNARADYFLPLSDGFYPDKSIAHYFSWLRTYDSLVFWQYIQKNNKHKKFFLNADVKWNQDLQIIKGYLDFAQTCTESFLVSLYRLAIERTIGFFSNAEKLIPRFCFFRNIDLLTKPIVDVANASLFDETQKESTNEVYVGSVFASGKSKEDAMFYVNLSNSILNIHFFSHPSSKHHVPHLFNWPSQSWIDKNFDRSSKKYERVGRTHVIAEHGYKSFPVPRFHWKNMNSFYYRNPRDTYDDWQDERSQIISMGHFNFEGKHDFFKINITKLMDESFLYNYGLANFLVSEFFLSLGGVIPDDLTEHGKKYIDSIRHRRDRESITKTALIVYANNSASSAVVDQIKKNFSEDLNGKIFALMPMNKERVGSSLLISPLVFDEIRSQLKKSKSKTVLLFDTSVISGRTRKELKHLLFHLGAEEVITLTVIDRFRLPFRVPNPLKHKSYWRLDAPRMGSAGMCPLCKGLKDIEGFKEDLASAFAIERIDQWKENWHVISYFNPQSDHGVKPTPITPMEKRFGIVLNEETGQFEQVISKEDKEAGIKNEIVLRNSLGVTIYATEIHSMTSRDDLALKLCKAENGLNNATIIEVLAVQLLLFSSEYSKNVHFEMIKKLFNACREIKQPDNHTALAALAILIQEKSIHKKLIHEIDKNWVSYSREMNFDVEILLAYVLKYLPSSEFEPDKIVRLLKFKNEETDLSVYQHLHYELYNEYGKIHTKPLIAFFEKREYLEKETRDATLRDAINSISKLIYLINKIPVWKLRRKYDVDPAPSDSHNKVLAQLHFFYEEFKKNIDSFTITGQETPEYEIEIEKLKARVRQELIPNLKNFHSYIFLSLKSDQVQEVSPVYEEMQQIVLSVSKHQWLDEAKNKEIALFKTKPPRVFVSAIKNPISNALQNRRNNAWMIYDSYIQQEIRFTIMNAIHSTQEIDDIWSVDGSNYRKAHLWVKVDYNNDFVILEFANASDMPAEKVKKKIEEKKKDGVIHLVDIGGHFDVVDHQDGDVMIIKTILHIPII